MIRSILLPLAEGSLASAAGNYAYWLAQKEGSSIHALAIVDIKSFEIPVFGTPDGFMPSVVSAPIEESQTLMQEMTALAKERLEQFTKECAARGIRCSTDIKTGMPGEIVAQEAVAHDIVIMARAGYSPTGSEQRLDDFIPLVIRGSIRPVLVAGRVFREVRQLLVAFDGSIHAARALMVAAELGSQSGVHCTLINVAGSEEVGKQLLTSAEAYLYHHGVTPKRQVVLGNKPSDIICELVGSTGTDLLVMGAYGHSPIREMIFGSTTEKVLSHCGCSVVLQS